MINPSSLKLIDVTKCFLPQAEGGCSKGRLGSWIISSFFALRKSWIVFAVCFGLLSICTVKQRPLFFFTAFGWIWATSEFLLLLAAVNSRGKTLVTQLHWQAHMPAQPPPCLTDNVICFRSCFFSFSILFSSHYFPSCGFICPKLVFRWNSVFQFPKASLLQWYASLSVLKVMNDFLYRGKNLQSSASVVFCVVHFCDIRLFFFFFAFFFSQIYLYSVPCVSLTLNLVLRVTKCKTWNQLWNEMAAAGLTCLWNPLSVNRPITLELTFEMAVVPVCLQAPWTQAESLHFSRIDRLLLSPLCCWKKQMSQEKEMLWT